MLFEKRVKLRLTDFDYKLPKTRIAQERGHGGSTPNLW